MTYIWLIILACTASVERYVGSQHKAGDRDTKKASNERRLSVRQIPLPLNFLPPPPMGDVPPAFSHPSCIRRDVCANVDYTALVKSGLLPTPQPIIVSPNPIFAYDVGFQNYSIQYSFLTGNPISYVHFFIIDSRTGAVYQTKPIPHKLTKKFEIVVGANKIGLGKSFSTSRLIIHVADDSFDSNHNRPRIRSDNSLIRPLDAANNYAPELQVTGLHGYLDEHSKIGSVVRTGKNLESRPLQILVTDQDLIPGMPPATYQYILTGLGASIFAINQAGFIYLNVESLPAGPDATEIYPLNVQAREVNTNPVRSSQVISLNITKITTNSHSPKFALTNYYAMAEPFLPFQNVFKVKASDEDRGKMGEINYKILSVSNGGKEYFVYKSDTNMLQAVRPLEPDQRYVIVLLATDNGGRSTKTNVQVEVASASTTTPRPKEAVFSFKALLTTQHHRAQLVTNPPLATPKAVVYNVSINEATPVNSIVTAFEGVHSHRTHYQILSGNELGEFLIDPKGGYLRTASTFQHDKKSYYQLHIRAIDDQAQYNVLVNVDIQKAVGQLRILNDQPITFYVKEVPPNYYVGQVLIGDKTGATTDGLVFDFEPPSRHFAIGNQDGIIRTRLTLSALEERTHQLKVSIRDLNHPQRSMEALITVNVIGDLTTSSSTNSPATRPQQPSIYFPVGFYNVSIQENAGPKELAKVEAIRNPPYEGSIMYEMKQGDLRFFKVDPSTGVVSTLMDLDAELGSLYNLIIGVKENSAGFENSTTKVTVHIIDANDWSPLFTPDKYYFTVVDDFMIGTPIYQMQAHDNDRTEKDNLITYRLVPMSEEDSYFSVEPNTGLLAVAKDLRSIQKTDFTLVIEAKDNGNPPLSSVAMVTISLVRKSTVQPTLVTFKPLIDFFQTTKKTALPLRFSLHSATASIMENVGVDYFVQVLPVENKPQDRRRVMCDIVSGNYGDSFFVLTNADGNCELRTNTDSLDKEKMDKYLLNISLSYGSNLREGEPADYMLVTVNVIDVNDNAPQFIYDDALANEEQTYFGALDVNAKEFTTILTVKAKDKDASGNADLKYSIPPEDSDGKYFTVSDNGELKNVRVLSEIPEKSSQFYHFRVKAADTPMDGSDAKLSFTDVKVNALTNANRFAMQLDGIVPEQAYKYVSEIKKSLQNKTGDCKLLGFESVKENKATSEDVTSTEIVWYAIEPRSGLICDREDFASLFHEENINKIRLELDAYFKMQSLKPSPGLSRQASAAPFGSLFSTDKWQAAEIALVTLASLVAFGAIVGVFASCYFWSKYKASKGRFRIPDKMHLYGIMPKYNDGLLLSTNSDKEYETQITQMAMSDEYQRYARSNADFSIDEGIYTIQRHVPSARPNLLAESRQAPRIYIPPPDYPINPATKNGRMDYDGLRPETLTIL